MYVEAPGDAGMPQDCDTAQRSASPRNAQGVLQGRSATAAAARPVHDHPLTAPARAPETKYRWKSRYTISTGTADMKMKAFNGP